MEGKVPKVGEAWFRFSKVVGDFGNFFKRFFPEKKLINVGIFFTGGPKFLGTFGKSKRRRWRREAVSS
jgi:hypothetical protein